VSGVILGTSVNNFTPITANTDCGLLSASGSVDAFGVQITGYTQITDSMFTGTFITVDLSTAGTDIANSI
jgi:hypothetical protein